MPKFSEAFLQRLKAIPIDAVASEFTPLKRVGNSFRGLSPFHAEKTPSFYCYPGSNRFKCYSTAKGGDTVGLVQEVMNLDFVEAGEWLASKFGIPVEFSGGAGIGPERSLRAEILAIYELAAGHFRQQFIASTPDGEAARAYWTNERKLTLQTAETFGIGFAASDDRHTFANQLFKKFSAPALDECGLFFFRHKDRINSPAEMILRWSGRLMIPIHDPQGRVIAFVGRQIPGIVDETVAGKNAKYLNSPDTPIFQKGLVLFNLARARTRLKDHATHRWTVVEGTLDVIRLWECGMPLAVATLGTAMTKEQIDLLAHLPNGVRAMLDGDGPGVAAALRIVPQIIASGADIVFNQTPQGHDPDSVMKGMTNPASCALRLAALTAHPMTPVGLAVRHYLQCSPAPTAAARAAAIKTIVDWITHNESAITWHCHLRELAKLAQIDVQALWAEIALAKKLPPPPAAPHPAPSPVPAGAELSEVA
jgi:DNA primase